MWNGLNGNYLIQNIPFFLLLYEQKISNKMMSYLDKFTFDFVGFADKTVLLLSLLSMRVNFNHLSGGFQEIFSKFQQHIPYLTATIVSNDMLRFLSTLFIFVDPKQCR